MRLCINGAVSTPLRRQTAVLLVLMLVSTSLLGVRRELMMLIAMPCPNLSTQVRNLAAL